MRWGDLKNLRNYIERCCLLGLFTVAFFILNSRHSFAFFCSHFVLLLQDCYSTCHVLSLLNSPAHPSVPLQCRF